MLNVAKIGEKVQVGRWVGGQYAGSVAAKVLSFEGDGKTQGTITVQLQNGGTETTNAFRVMPWPASERFPRFRKAVAK